MSNTTDAERSSSFSRQLPHCISLSVLHSRVKAGTPHTHRNNPQSNSNSQSVNDMSWCESAARTNLSSQEVALNRRDVKGQGAFRIAYGGTYIGGNRNQQQAVCKCFKSQYQVLEAEFFRNDYKIADRAIEFCEEWNSFCESKKEIMMTKGTVMVIGGKRYMVEPLIRYYTKYTSNNGWYDDI